jgi:hypothetical protein
MGPKKGTKLDFSGVPGRLVDAAPPDVLFGARKSKLSPYDPLLLQLQRAGSGKFLKFEDLRAKASLAVRAKKLNIKILFGEQGSTLWVTLAKAELSTNGSVEEPPATKARPLPDIVLEGIANDKRDTPGLMVSYARLHGAPDVTLNAVDRVIAELARAGKIKLKPVKNKADDTERWMPVA